MKDQTIADEYMKALQKKRASRVALSTVVTTISNSKRKYDSDALASEERARRVFNDRNNGLSPSEEADWSDKINRAYRTQAYFQISLR